MPRNVRNWWIELDVDGKKGRVESEPRSKDGGFRLTIKQRNGEQVSRSLDVEGFVDELGDLVLIAQRQGEGTSIEVRSRR